MNVAQKQRICQSLVEFFEIAIYGLLKWKQIYPDVIFVRKQKYGYVVYDTIHPQLKEYMMNYLEAVYNFAFDEQLDRVVICFFNKSYKAIKEKVVFEVAPVKKTLADCNNDDKYFTTLEKTFRSFFMNLNLLNESNEGLRQKRQGKDEIKFALQIYTAETNATPFMENANYHDFPWMQVTSRYCKITDGEIMPFHIEDNDFINMQIYIEK